MPVFIVLYAVLRGLTRRASLMGFNVGFAGGQLGTGAPHHQAARADAPPNSVLRPVLSPHATTLYQNLSHSNTMQALGMDLPGAPARHGPGVGHALPYIMLIAIVGVTGWVQQKQIQGRTPASSVPQQQQAIMKIMPFFLPGDLDRAARPAWCCTSRCRTSTGWASSGSSAAASTAMTPPAAAGPGKAIAGSPNGPKGPKSDSGTVAEAKPAGFMARLAAASQRDDPADGQAGVEGEHQRIQGRGIAAANGRPPSRRRAAKEQPAKAPASHRPSRRQGDRPSRRPPSRARAPAVRRSTKANGATTDNAKPTQPVPQPRARKNKKG